MSDLTGQETLAAWQTAAKVWGVDVIAPFVFTIEGRTHECVALVAHFGTTKGMAIKETSPPSFEIDKTFSADADREGYGCSFINGDLYKRFDRDRFIETLIEWGFYGPEEKRPRWWTNE